MGKNRRRRRRDAETHPASRSDWAGGTGSPQADGDDDLDASLMIIASNGRDELFEKEFIFVPLKHGAASLPCPEDLFSGADFVDDALMRVKEELNATRTLLSEKDILVWHEHTRFTSHAGSVVRHLRRNMNPELCTIAWAKMTEILERYQLLSEAHTIDRHRINTLHVCEAPGGFVTATNHHIRTKFPSAEWDWRAQSLNPYHEGNDLHAMLDDDRFILETQKNWHFGEDNTGSLLSHVNIESLWRVARGMGGIALVTADGSVDCADDPYGQETTVAGLHLAEFVFALGALSVGGSLVLKLFTCFESQTVGLLYIAQCVFSRVALFKPATSKSGNSETYLVASGFMGISGAHLERLLSVVSRGPPAGVAMVRREHIPDAFMEQMRACVGQFCGWQRDVITRNLALEGKISPSLRHFIGRLKSSVAEEYVWHYSVVPLDEERKIAPYAGIDGSFVAAGLSVSSALNGNAAIRGGGSLAVRREVKRKHDGFVEGDIECAGESIEAKRPRTEFDAIGTPGCNLYGAEDGSVAPEGVYSKFAIEQMKRLGHVAGSGLGVSGHGISRPISPAVKKDRLGIGSDPSAVSEGVGDSDKMSAAEVFVDSEQQGGGGSWMSYDPERVRRANILAGRDDVVLTLEQCIEREQWECVTGRALSAVLMSKFCPLELLKSLWVCRTALLPKVDGVAESDRQVARSRAFAVDALRADASMHAQVPFTSHDAIEYAALNRVCEWLMPSVTLPPRTLTCVDLAGTHPGFAEFVGWKIGARCKIIVAWRADSTKSMHGECLAGTQSKFCTRATCASLVSTGGVCGGSNALVASVRPFLMGSHVDVAHVDAYPRASRANCRHREGTVHAVLVEQFRAALSLLGPGGVLLMRVGDCFTRFTAGFLYLAYRLFETVGIVKPFAMDPASDERFVVCLRLRGDVDADADKSAVLALLSGVENSLQGVDDACDVHEIVPNRHLLERNFWEAVLAGNIRIGRREIAANLLLCDMLHVDGAVGDGGPAAAHVTDALEALDLQCAD